MHATVIHLGPKPTNNKPKPNVSHIQEVSFEEAFGEHSEAHGKLLKKLKSAKPFKKIAAKIKSTAAHMKAKAAARRAARHADDDAASSDDSASTDDSSSSSDAPTDDSSSTDSGTDSSSSDNSEDTQSAEGSIQKHNHKITHMENATIIRLAPNQQLQRVTSFEEAFGEHSNLFGSLRARWLKKRAANQKIIQEAKREINDEKTETKVNRIRNRAKKRVARVQKRGSIQQARIAKRRAAQQARIEKRTAAKQARLNKKNLGQDDSPPADGDTSSQDSGTDDGSQDTGNSESPDDTGRSIADNSDSGSDDSSAPDDGSDDSSEPDNDTETSNGGDVDYGGGGDDSGSDDGGGTDSADGYSDTFDGSNGDYDSFDGDETKLAPDDFYDYKEGDQRLKARIHPKVKEAAVKSEWNKECVCKLQSQFDALESDFDGSDESEIRSEFLAGQIDKRRQRAMMFDKQLNNYASAPGARKPRRVAEVAAAKREARKQRIGVRRGSQNAVASQGNPVTAIEQGLNPEFSDNKITVPAAGADGSEAQDYFCGADGYKTGITAIDSKNDFDAPNAIDINLGFDASVIKTEATSIIKSVNWKAVGITAVVTIALVAVVSKLSK